MWCFYVTIFIPPPIIVIPPSWVLATTESIKALVPLANASNSNTPAGLKVWKYRCNRSLYYSYKISWPYHWNRWKLMFSLPIPDNKFRSFNDFIKKYSWFWSCIKPHNSIWNSSFQFSCSNLFRFKRILEPELIK